MYGDFILKKSSIKDLKTGIQLTWDMVTCTQVIFNQIDNDNPNAFEKPHDMSVIKDQLSVYLRTRKACSALDSACYVSFLTFDFFLRASAVLNLLQTIYEKSTGIDSDPTSKPSQSN